MPSMRPNRVKHKLAAGELATGVMGTGMTADLIEWLGPLGFDSVWLEGEHGPLDYRDIPDMSRATDLWGMTSIVRVNENRYGPIYRVLDLGAQGVCVPHVDTRDQAQAVADASKFFPVGKRGITTSRQGYGVSDFLERANDECLAIILIEDILAVNNPGRDPSSRGRGHLLCRARRPGAKPGSHGLHTPRGAGSDRPGVGDHRGVRPPRGDVGHVGERRALCRHGCRFRNDRAQCLDSRGREGLSGEGGPLSLQRRLGVGAQVA